MEQSRYTFYCTGLHKSKHVGSYVCQALQKLSKPVDSFCFEDIPIVYGVLAGAGDIIRKCRMARLPYVHIDNGYFRPGYSDGYYRITKCGERSYVDVPVDPQRFYDLDIPLLPMRRSKYIVLCAPSELGCYATPYDKLSPSVWTNCMRAYINSLGLKQKVFVTHKQGGEFKLSDLLSEADIVIGCSSNTVIDALAHGIRAVDMAPWLRYLFPTTRILSEWATIRHDYFTNLAYRQMRLCEFTRERIENVYYSN